MSTVPVKNIAPSPTLGDILKHFFTDKPLLSQGMHNWISFTRSTVFFIALDVVTYFTDAFNTGVAINAHNATTFLLPQIAYIIVRTVQHVAAVSNSPLTPLISAAADKGVTSVEHLIVSGGNVAPDVTGLPDAPINLSRRPDTPPYQ